MHVKNKLYIWLLSNYGVKCKTIRMFIYQAGREPRVIRRSKPETGYQRQAKEKETKIRNISQSSMKKYRLGKVLIRQYFAKPCMLLRIQRNGLYTKICDNSLKMRQ